MHHKVYVAVTFAVNEVKTRVASLRTQYGKLIKPKASGSGQKPLTPKQQWILQHLDFLRAHVTHRHTESTLRVSLSFFFPFHTQTNTIGRQYMLWNYVKLSRKFPAWRFSFIQIIIVKLFSVGNCTFVVWRHLIFHPKYLNEMSNILKLQKQVQLPRLNNWKFAVQMFSQINAENVKYNHDHFHGSVISKLSYSSSHCLGLVKIQWETGVCPKQHC